MNETIYFRTSLFDLSDEEENPINPIYGKTLLLWLTECLKDEVLITEPSPEDWGWYSELEWEGRSYLIGASSEYEKGDDPKSEIEWVLQVHKHRSLKEKLLGKHKMSKSDNCFMLFKALFENEPNISSVGVG